MGKLRQEKAPQFRVIQCAYSWARTVDSTGDPTAFPSLAFEGVDKTHKYALKPVGSFQIESQMCRKNM